MRAAFLAPSLASESKHMGRLARLFSFGEHRAAFTQGGQPLRGGAPADSLLFAGNRPLECTPRMRHKNKEEFVRRARARELGDTWSAPLE
jgi:hypothetical protein